MTPDELVRLVDRLTVELHEVRRRELVRDANARLIAAAPELLAALRDVLEDVINGAG